MMARAVGWGWLAVGLVLSGCGGGESSQPAEADAATAAVRVESGEPAEVTPASVESAPADGELGLRLRVGDRFPLLKTVTQVLTQMTPQGEVRTHSRLEVLLAMQVEEVQPDGRKKLAVRYERVRYAGDAGGRPVEFDSRSPRPLPPELLPYGGLVGNGFAFRLGPDNRLVELVGFADFLSRCVRDVPAERQQAVLQALAETTGEDAVASFVDASIGLLPSLPEGRRLHVGDRWEHRHQLPRPLPVVLHTACTLAELNEQVAEIDIAGTIAAGPTTETVADDIRVTIRGGRTQGHCTIDRATGLPLDSHVEHTLDMLVQPAHGEPFPQSKHIVTTIRAFPQQR